MHVRADVWSNGAFKTCMDLGTERDEENDR